MSVLALLLTLNFLFSGCRKKEPKAEATARAAIQPGADLVAIFDGAAARKAPIYKKIEEKQNSMGSINPLASQNKELEQKIKEATGLKDEDFKSMVASMNMSNVDFEEKNPQKLIDNMGMAAALEFKKPITAKQLKKVVNLMITEAAKQGLSKKTTIVEEEISGRYAISIDNIPIKGKPGRSVGTDTAINMFLGLSENGKVVFITLNKGHLSEMIARVEEGKKEKIPDSLDRISKNIPSGTQFQVLFAAPDKLRKQIGEQIKKTEQAAAKQPGKGMQLSFMKPFEKLRSIGFGMKLSDAMDIIVLTDLGDSQKAQQVAGMLNGMVVPMLSAQMQQKRGGKPPINVSEMIKITAPDTSVKLEISMTEEMLESATSPAPADSASANMSAPQRGRRKPTVSSRRPAREKSANKKDSSSGSISDLIGKPLSQVKERLGRTKGELKTGNGNTVWIYENYEIHSKDGKTVSSIKDISGGSVVPVTSDPVK